MTKEKILIRVRKIKELQGELETELDLLWIEWQKLEKSSFSGHSKHPW